MSIENDFRAQLAERDSLLRDVVDGKHATPGWNQRMKAALDGGKAPSVTCNLARATDFVERLVYCAGTQQSVATGYLRDILEVLKGGEVPSDPVERDERADCSICLDLGDQCLECEESDFREWAERHFARADFRKTAAGVFIQDWMRHAFAAWQARAALDKATEGASHE